MSHISRCSPCLMVVAGSLVLLAGTASAGPIQMHPSAVPLPTTQQGPFVTTADGGILCVDATQAHHSLDEGKTWSSVPLFKDAAKFDVSGERALLRTKEGVVISAWMNMKEAAMPMGPSGYIWGGNPEELSRWILPTYVCRSLDDGKTWEEPILIHKPWCGCIHSLIQLRSGRLVLVGQSILPAWRHASLTFVSDDQGKSWRASNYLDYAVGRHDHAGSIEATVLERADGSLYMLLRTESGFFYEAESADGLTWAGLQKSKIPSVGCCGNLYRLSDGRAVLLWNHPLRSQPQDLASREELSVAFSKDDGRTWEDRTVIAARYRQPGDGHAETRVSYPYLYERHPGELWITTMQGALRMKIQAADVPQGETPPQPSIVMLGDSTTAYRPGEVKLVASDLLGQNLMKSTAPLQVLNRGVPSSTVVDGLKRYQAEIDKLDVKVVVIQFGINDAAVDVWKNPPAVASRVSLADYTASLKSLVELSRAKGVRVILATTNPVRWTEKLKGFYGKPPYEVAADDGFDRPVLSKYNAATKQLAEDLGVAFVDLHQVYLDAAQRQGVPVGYFLLDGMHPNDAGHELTAQTLLPVIQQQLEQSK